MTIDQPNPQFREESRLIPWWSYVLALGFFAGIQVLMFKLMAADPRPKPLAFTLTYSILFGMFIAFQMLLIGYVTRDAKRRGMNPVVWLIILISLLMTGVGFIVYFLFRAPIVVRCPQCSSQVSKDHNFCTKCSRQLRPICHQCSKALRPGDLYCADCGAGVGEASSVVAISR